MIKATNELVKQYEPLINKIVKQFYNNVKYPWEDIKSMAYEGLAIAFNNYDDKKSSMSFTQFAAFAIKNNILTGLDNELRTVKLSAYAQKKITDAGGTTFNTVSIDQPYYGDDEVTPREIVTGMYENEKFSDGNVLDYLCSRIKEEFNERDSQMFFKSFGLDGYDDTPGKQIAKEYGVSEGLVSQRIKKVILFIRADKELCEVLSTLMDGTH